MMTRLNELLADLTIGDAMSFERLSVTPLRLTRTSTIAYQLLDDVAVRDLVEIEEVSNSGSVPELWVRNRSKQHVLIPDGSTLIGTKQNRVVNLTIMLAPESVTVMPVSCVESGRWSFATRRSSPSEYCDKHLRMMMCVDATDSLKTQKKVSVDQGAVWRHVNFMLAGSGAKSPTAAYHAVYQEWEKPLAEHEAQLPCPEEACGVAVQLDGNVEVIDLFDKSDTLRTLWPRLLRSYVLETLSAPRTPSHSRDVNDFLNQALQSEGEPFESVGSGTTVRLTTRDSVGAALLCDRQLVHLSLFAGQGG